MVRCLFKSSDSPQLVTDSVEGRAVGERPQPFKDQREGCLVIREVAVLLGDALSPPSRHFEEAGPEADAAYRPFDDALFALPHFKEGELDARGTAVDRQDASCRALCHNALPRSFWRGPGFTNLALGLRPFDQREKLLPRRREHAMLAHAVQLNVLLYGHPVGFVAKSRPC